jgi:hypothetical protein
MHVAVRYGVASRLSFGRFACGALSSVLFRDPRGFTARQVHSDKATLFAGTVDCVYVGF